MWRKQKPLIFNNVLCAFYDCNGVYMSSRRVNVLGAYPARELMSRNREITRFEIHAKPDDFSKSLYYGEKNVVFSKIHVWRGKEGEDSSNGASS